MGYDTFSRISYPLLRELALDLVGNEENEIKNLTVLLIYEDTL